MGAWEVQADPSKPGNRLMRQVSPVWPACWGYSCTGAARQTDDLLLFVFRTFSLCILFPSRNVSLFCLSAGPMTYFGPKHFNASGPTGFKISLDVRACQLPLPSPLFPPPLLFLPLIYVCRLGLHLLFPPPYRPPFPFDV